MPVSGVWRGMSVMGPSKGRGGGVNALQNVYKCHMMMQQQVTLESLDRKLESLRVLLTRLLDTVSGENAGRRETKEKRDVVAEMPPIRNVEAADLLGMSTRQLQRVRRRYRLVWEIRGREVFYQLAPILRAIRRFNLCWNATVLDRLMDAHRSLPYVR